MDNNKFKCKKCKKKFPYTFNTPYFQKIITLAHIEILVNHYNKNHQIDDVIHDLI